LPPIPPKGGLIAIFNLYWGYPVLEPPFRGAGGLSYVLSGGLGAKPWKKIINSNKYPLSVICTFKIYFVDLLATNEKLIEINRACFFCILFEKILI
jgi:hypothetical protein